MKKILLAAAGLLALTLITACANYMEYPVPEAPMLPPPPATEDNELLSNWQGLHMYVALGSVTPTGLQLSMVNEGEINFGHGLMFSIEQHLDGAWVQVPFINDIGWRLPLLSVSPFTTIEENISWEHMHGQLPPGQYRVVRNFIIHDMFDPAPMWERDIPESYLYAVFTVGQDWQASHDVWQHEQDDLAAIAFARFAGLDLEILEYSPRGLTFTLTNNASYSYIIDSIFVGWEDAFPDGGFAGAVEYSIFSRWMDGGEEKKLLPGEQLSLEVDWYSQIGNLSPGMERRHPPTRHIFDLVVDVTLDVDDDYIRENFRHVIPGVPGVSHRINAYFDLTP